MTVAIARPTRLAAVIDCAIDVDAFLGLLDASAYELVAVLVRPEQLELTRTIVPRHVRCVTHPAELDAIPIDVRVSWRADAGVRRYGDRLAATQWNQASLPPRRAAERAVTQAPAR